MGVDAGLLRALGPQLELLLPVLDEKSRRLALGAVARAAGDGGIGAVARLTGASWQTVADGAAELESGVVAADGRIRRPGAGRPKLAGTDPGLVPALLALVEDSSRGDPESPLAWTTKSVKNLAGELTAAGHRCSPQTAWRLLHEQGFSTQANAKVREGKRHPDRDAQFRYIAAQASGHLAAAQPVISVDAKKKEQVGEYAQGGREWRPRGDPVKVRDHGFADRRGGHAIPYGIYDVGANTGFVNVGTDHNTAALAVESVRRWWQLAGQDAYPAASRLLICCDAGGSNGWRNRAWKAGLARLAAETGLEITVCHFPPGTSKWNKIEHRLFSQITLAWRGRPLTSHDVIINTIAAVTTATGLTVTAVLDDGSYPAGVRIGDEHQGHRGPGVNPARLPRRLELRLRGRPPARAAAPAAAGPARTVRPGHPGPPRADRPGPGRPGRPGRRAGTPVPRLPRTAALRPLRPPPRPARPGRRAQPQARPGRPPDRHPAARAPEPARAPHRRPARHPPDHHQPRHQPHRRPARPDPARHRAPGSRRAPRHPPAHPGRPAPLRRPARHHHPRRPARSPHAPRR
jgi:hypothetical protein